MSQQVAITVKDSDHTTTLQFDPVQSSNGTFGWRTNKAGVPYIGQPTLAMSMNDDARLPTRRVRLVITIPSMETVTGSNSAGYTAPPKVAFNDKLEVNFTINKRSANASFLRTILQEVISAVDLNTSTVNSTRVNIYEAIDSGIQPV